MTIPKKTTSSYLYVVGQQLGAGAYGSVQRLNPVHPKTKQPIQEIDALTALEEAREVKHPIDQKQSKSKMQVKKEVLEASLQTRPIARKASGHVAVLQEELAVLEQAGLYRHSRAIGFGQNKYGPYAYFDMEVIPGTSLAHTKAAEDINKLTFAQKTQLALQLTQQLAHLHQRGIIHFDIKPANIMVDIDFSNPDQPKGQVSIIDLGLALRIPIDGSSDILYDHSRLTFDAMLGMEHVPAETAVAPKDSKLSAKTQLTSRTDTYMALGPLLLLLGATDPYSRKDAVFQPIFQTVAAKRIVRKKANKLKEKIESYERFESSKEDVERAIKALLIAANTAIENARKVIEAGEFAPEQKELKNELLKLQEKLKQKEDLRGPKFFTIMKEMASLTEEVNNTVTKVAVLDTKFLDEPFCSDGMVVPDIEIEGENVRLDKLIADFTGRMQARDFRNRPQDEEVSRFFLLLNKLALCEEQRQKIAATEAETEANAAAVAALSRDMQEMVEEMQQLAEGREWQQKIYKEAKDTMHASAVPVSAPPPIPAPAASWRSRALKYNMATLAVLGVPIAISFLCKPEKTTEFFTDDVFELSGVEIPVYAIVIFAIGVVALSANAVFYHKQKNLTAEEPAPDISTTLSPTT